MPYELIFLLVISYAAFAFGVGAGYMGTKPPCFRRGSAACVVGIFWPIAILATGIAYLLSKEK